MDEYTKFMINELSYIFNEDIDVIEDMMYDYKVFNEEE